MLKNSFHPGYSKGPDVRDIADGAPGTHPADGTIRMGTGARRTQHVRRSAARAWGYPSAGGPADGRFSSLLILQDGVHPGCRFVQESFGCPFRTARLPQLPEGCRQFVGLRVEIARRNRLGQHILDRLVVGRPFT